MSVYCGAEYIKGKDRRILHMKKKLLASLLCMAMASSLLIGCGGSSDSEKEGLSLIHI